MLVLLLACHADDSVPIVRTTDDTGIPCDATTVVGFADLDSDGHGDPLAPRTACDSGATVPSSDDCDDDDATIHSGATETCDQRDEDCDDVEDDGLVATWYADADGDLHGDPATGAETCEPEKGWVSAGDDCDDDAPLAWTGAEEICGDGVDNDCDGGGCPLTGTVDVTDAFAVHKGTDIWDYAGLGVATLGDWNGDGLDDLFIGASLEDATAEDSGAGYVVTATESGPLSGAYASFDGPHVDAGLGQSVANVSDVTGDGRVDLVAGIPYFVSAPEYRPGAVVLFDGTVGDELDVHTKYLGATNYETLGYATAPLDDVDGDGTPEFLLGSPSSGYGVSTTDGAVNVVYDAPGGEVEVSAVAWRLAGSTSSGAGAALAEIGDVDGDGRRDAFVGSFGLGEAVAWLVTDGWGDALLDDVATTRLLRESSTDAAGTAVGAGDMDGDGRADLIVGGYAENTNGTYAGAAWLVLGTSTGDVPLEDADAKVLGENANSFTGIAVGSVWDQDGDGGTELVVGARQEGEGGTNAGAVFLVSGSTRGVVETSDHLTKIIGPKGALVGQRVGNAGDLDGDGAGDLWISGTGYDGNRGGVFLMSMTDL